MLRDGRARDPELGGELAYGLLACREQLQEPPPVGFGKDRHEIGHNITLAETNTSVRAVCARGQFELRPATGRRGIRVASAQQAHEEAVAVRMSRLFGETLREAPAGIESAGHQFLLRAGYVRQLGQGIFSYLPLGWQSMMHIEQILREELTAIGGVEVSLPVVHPAELWQQSGRYQKIGAELTRFKDRRDREMVLAMTHEEVVASLAAGEISSYRQLPKLVFQIQIKWRDDPRPRAGLIRAREFTMKDSYSLDLDEAGLDDQYRAHYEAYFKIFSRCGLAGRRRRCRRRHHGGQRGARVHVPDARSARTRSCCVTPAVTPRTARWRPRRKAAAEPEEPREVRRVETPHATTIDELAAMLEVAKARTAKMVFLAAEQRGEDGEPVVRPIVGGGPRRHRPERGQARQPAWGGRAAPHDPRGDRLDRRRRRVRLADRAQRRPRS